MAQAWRWATVVASAMITGFMVAALWLSASAVPVEGRYGRGREHFRAGRDFPRQLGRSAHLRRHREEDASFALGWVHAEDRLWQMESMRRLAAGRLAELVGPEALASDRWMRTLSLYRLAERDYATLSGRSQKLLDAYARGVNAWLAARSRALPPEFILLGFAPQPWKPADSLVWLKLMALRLSSDRRNELLRARLAGRLSPEQIRQLWPDDRPGAHVTLGAAAESVADGLLAQLSDMALDPPGQPFGASNAWVISGRHTTSGKPILANDPHLGFTLPGAWYLARIVTPQGELAGATAPGFPALVLGHNTQIAWRITGFGNRC